MKFYILILSFLFTGICVAQQKPQYTQYILNPYLINPALSGVENYIDLKAGYRQQWSGIKEAPKTSYLTVHLPLGNDYLWDNILTQFPGEDGNPMSRNYMQNYTSSPAHHGVGASIVYDKAGPLTNLNATLSYAYHLKLNSTYNFSLGISAGIIKSMFDINALYYGIDADIDPATATVTNNTSNTPDLNFGAWLYGPRFFAGLSAQQLIPGKKGEIKNDIKSLNIKTATHYLGTAGYKFYVNESVDIIPSFLVRYALYSPMSFDLNAKANYQDKLWLGASYRKQDSWSAYFGFSVSKMISLSYAYDFNYSDLSAVSNGSHEIALGLLLDKIYKVPSSARF